MKYFGILFLVFLPITGFAQQVTWDVSLWGKKRAFTEHVEKLRELVAQKTNGEFILNLSYGGLSKPKENLDGISAGLFEMAQFCAGYHKEKNPSITVLELPFLGVKTLTEERTISQWLYRHPAVRSDFKKWNAIALMPSPLPQYNLIGAGKAPLSLMELAGLDVRATGGIGKAMEALGAMPKPIVATEVRQALESGEINAVAFAPHAHMSFGTIANSTWWTTNLNPGTVNCPVVANIDAIAKLSAAHRDALYGSINEALDYYIAHYEYNMRESWEPALKELGIEKVTFSDIEVNYFKERVEKPAAMEWIAEQEKAGLPARQIYDLVKVALAGENPERALLAENQINAVDMQGQQEQAKKQQILNAYTFDKKTSGLPAASNAMKLLENGAVKNQQSNVQFVQPEIAQTDSQQELQPTLDIKDSISEDGFIKGGIPALFYDDRLNKKNIQQGAAPATTLVANRPGVGYFGTPRKGDVSSFNADPLKALVEWDLASDTTVGATVVNLSDYIGYELVTNDPTAMRVYSLGLPGIQQKISSISVGDAFQVLSGRGLVTVFDHTYRTVKHVPMKRQGAGIILPCPADLDVGDRTGEGVLLLSDGTQCSY